MLFKEIIAVYTENKRPIKQIPQLLVRKSGAIYIYQSF
jgi:hypothetical protein